MSITDVMTSDKEILEIFYIEYTNNESLSYCAYGNCYDAEKTEELKK